MRISRSIFEKQGHHARVVIGIGDDAAAIEADDGLILVSSDMVFSATHFPEGSPPGLCGWYAAAVNLSDIAAKGGKPTCMVLDIGLPGDFPLRWYEEVLGGFAECCRQYRLPVVGGDTKSAPALMMAPTIIGRIGRGRFMARKGADAGDVLCHAGTLGGSHGALVAVNEYLSQSSNVTENAGSRYWQVNAEDDIYGDYEALLRVRPHIKAGRTLAKSGRVTSCMDVSDGLALSMYEMSAAGGIGFRLKADALPLHDRLYEEGFDGERAMDTALYTGGDFGLLFTVKPKHAAELLAMFDEGTSRPPVSVIGEVVEMGITIVIDGKEKNVERRGWEHLVE